MKSELLAGLQVRACATEVRAEPTPIEEVLDRVLAPIYLRQLVGYKLPSRSGEQFVDELLTTR